MKNWKDIFNQIRANKEQIEQDEKKVREMPYSKRTEPEIVRLAEEAEILKIENKILRDNMRRSYAAEKLPAVLDILNSYAGKKYGPKTKDAAQNRGKEESSCSFFHDCKSYSQILELVPLDDKGYSGTIFRYNDFQFSAKRDESGNLLELIDGENKVCKRAPEDFYLLTCGEYIENTRERAEQIRNDFAALKEKYAEFDAACSAWSKIIPSGIEYVSADHFTAYLRFC